MRLIMNEILIMNFGGVIVNQHYLHTLLHDVIESYYDPPKFIMSISFIMSLIITLIVFQCTTMWSVQSAPQVLSSAQRSVTGSVDQRQNALQTGSRDLL